MKTMEMTAEQFGTDLTDLKVPTPKRYRRGGIRIEWVTVIHWVGVAASSSVVGFGLYLITRAL